MKPFRLLSAFCGLLSLLILGMTGAFASSTTTPPSWPSSDSRMDTTFAYASVTLDPNHFNNIADMPLLLELDINRIENLRAVRNASGQYDYSDYRGDLVSNGQISQNVVANRMTKAESEFIKGYYPGFFGRSNPDMGIQYWSFREFIRKRNPSQLIGSYISGSSCRDDVSPDYFPADILDCHRINPVGHYGLLKPEAVETVQGQDTKKRWLLHPTDSNNMKVLQQELVRESIARNADFVFFDNMGRISYRKIADDPALVSGFISHMDTLSRQLNELGYRAVYNLGKLPNWKRDANLNDPTDKATRDAFNRAIGSNGIFLEVPFRYMDNADDTEWEMNEIRGLLQQGGLVVLAPYPGGYHNSAHADWMAAMAMMLREKDDSLFVATSRDIDPKLNLWKDWPDQYGPPTGQAMFTKMDANNWYVSRSFANGKITVVHFYVGTPGPTGAISLPSSIPTGGFTVLPGREPKRGTWNGKYTADSSLLEPKRDDGYSDRFVLGKLPNGDKTFWGEIIAVDVVIQTTVFR